jgi:hypothetical protein
VEYVFEEEKLSYNSIVHEVFHGCRLVPTIPHLIEEVPDFKGFIAGCIAKGDEALEGYTKAQHFKLFVDSSSCPMMKYRIHYSDNDWLQKEGGGIKLWREDKEGRFYGHVENLLLYVYDP